MKVGHKVCNCTMSYSSRTEADLASALEGRARTVEVLTHDADAGVVVVHHLLLSSLQNLDMGITTLQDTVPSALSLKPRHGNYHFTRYSSL